MRAVVWTKSDSPLGTLYVAAKGDRLIALSYGGGEEPFINQIERFGAPVLDGRALKGLVDQLNEYFAGERTAFDVKVDLSGLTRFQRSVLEATLAIPYGMVKSYKEVADAVGNPGAARAVGGALANNPISIVVPCHRVIASDGTIGGYSSAGGTAAKRRLLELEGVANLAGKG